MNGSERKKFLVGLFATWFAAQRGREKPSAKDKKDAIIVADHSELLYDYYSQFGYGGNKGSRSIRASS